MSELNLTLKDDMNLELDVFKSRASANVEMTPVVLPQQL